MSLIAKQIILAVGGVLFFVGSCTAFTGVIAPFAPDSTQALGFSGASKSGSAAPSSTAKQFIEDIDGVSVGPANARQRAANTAAINVALAAGSPLYLRPGSRIEIGGSLIVPSGGAIIGTGPRDRKAVIYLPSAQFPNRDKVESRYSTGAVGINFSGQKSGATTPTNGVRLESFVIESDPGMGRFIRGIVGQNVRDCVIKDVEVRGIPTGVGITLASARGCTITGAYIHDFADRTKWASLPQLTGIEIDNDIVGGVTSSDVVIDGFRIENLVVSGPFLERWGYQTDGINVLKAGSRVRIANGTIREVGEGIDIFGSDGAIDNVQISDVYLFGLKFIHGASRNRVSNVTITNAGLAGVTFSGSDETDQDTTGNVISSLVIRGVDTKGKFRDNDSAGILIGNSGAARGKPRDNQIIGARIDLGPNGKYGWLDSSTGSGNSGSDLDIAGGGGRATKVFIMRGGGSVKLKGADAELR